MTYHQAVVTSVSPVRVQAQSPALIESTFGLLTFSAIYLQKINVPGLGGDFGLDYIVLWGVLLWLVIRGAASVHPLRLLLYIAVICPVILSLILEQGIFSVPALMLFLLVNGTILMVADVDQASMLRCYKIFQTMMLPIACIVIGQQVLQFTVGNQYWPNLNELLPGAILLQGAAYIRPLAWQSPYLIPNGVFFLEPSSVSLFIAVSIAIEVVWLKRFRYLCLFGFVLLISMTGTGITVLALLLPALLSKMDCRLRRLTLKASIPILLIAGTMGINSYLAERSDELSDPKSSGYARMYVPFENTIKLFSDPSYLLSGMGPGSTPKAPEVSESFVTWPSDKLAYEYGTLTSVTFHVFLLISVLGQATSRLVALVGLLPTLVFGGGFLSAPNTMLMIMFGSLLRLREPA